MALKNSKKSTNDSRPDRIIGTSVGDIHRQYCDKFMSEIESLPKKKSEILAKKSKLRVLKKRAESTKNGSYLAKISELEDEIYHLQEKIDSITRGDEMMEYNAKTGDILHNSNSCVELDLHQIITRNPDNIMHSGVFKTVKVNEDNQKQTQEYRKYLDVLNSKTSFNDQTSTECSNLGCPGEKILSRDEDHYVCSFCGLVENIREYDACDGSKDISSETSKSTNNKIPHFRDKLKQLQGKASKHIPDQVYQDVLDEIKYCGLDMCWIKPKEIKSILGKKGHPKYYSCSVQIHQKITGSEPCQLTPEQESRMEEMFSQAERTYDMYKPPGKNNLQVYTYIIRKLSEILECWEFANTCTKLKDTDKLKDYDRTWKLICQHHGWKFIPSV